MNDNELKWQTRDEMPTPTNPLQRMRETFAFTSRDCSEDKMIAFLYGIVMGWDDESYNELKKKHIYDITALWGEAKTYYRNQLREMGGSYASWGNSISVRLNNPINNTPIKFDVELDEVR